MMREKDIKKIERTIISKMKMIENNKISLKESKIGLFFNALKDVDEVSYERLISKYKRIISKI
jgi:transcriptional regulator NrdR family protein